MNNSLLKAIPLAFLVACGGSTEPDPINCPAGTVRDGNKCVAPPGDSGVPETDTGIVDPDTGIVDPDSGIPDPDGGGDDDAGLPDAVVLSATSIDFGRSVNGEEHTQTVTIDNGTSEQVTVRVGIISGPQGGDFSVTSSDPITPSGIMIQAGARVTLTFAFEPRAAGPRNGSLALELCATGCPETITLTGVGLEDALDCAPTSIDFLLVNPNSCVTENVECTNAASYDAVIASAEIGAGSSTAFGVETMGFPITVPAGGSAFVGANYCPTGLTMDTGTLELTVVHPDPLHALKTISLSGAGGGGDLQCSPTSISFGVLATGQTATRSVICENAGNAPVSITDVTFTLASAPELTVVSGGAVTIDPQQTTEIIVQYAPQTAQLHDGILEVHSNDRDTPVLQINVSGEAVEPNGCALVLSPAAIDFGAVLINTTAQASATFNNTGTGACSINLIGLVASTAAEYTLVTTPQTATVNPGDSFTVEVEFAPAIAQIYSGAITLMTTDLMLPAPEITLNGGGVDASYPLSATPSPLDFGTSPAACSDPVIRSVRVVNTGAATTVLAELEAGSSAAFTVNTTSFMIGASSFADVPVNFAPATAGAHNGRLRLTPGALPPIFVSLEGLADMTGHNSQTFTSPGTQVIDLLLVVDDSCSMAEEQANLANTAATLIARADLSGADYHIAVTTTDPGGFPPAPQGGTLRGSPAVITGSSPTRIQDLQTSISQGTNGSGTEEGLFAAAEAVTNPTLLMGPNAGFLRPNGELVIVVLTDEEDFSPNTVASYVTQIQNRPSGLPGAVRLYSLTGGATGCTGPGGTADAGLRYLEAVALLNGFDRSICDANYQQSISDITDAAFDPTRSVYTLNSQPAPGSIEVYVDNVLTLPDVGNTAVWRVSYADNQIVFAPGQAPPSNATVRVEYDAFCVATTCGNGTPQAGEQCDDGNMTETDACPSTCYVAFCGDGFIRSNVEGCDDFNTIAGDGCNSFCIVEGCGNGFVEPGEECDNGASNSNTMPDACRTNCAAAGCGDAVIDSGETCEDGNTNNGDACAQCLAAVCGDGFVRTGVEQCDDGNTVDTDSCDNACALQTFTVTSVANSPLIPSAGGTAIAWPNTQGDEDVVQTSIGFNFNYLGAPVSDVWVVSNGYLAFEAPLAANYTNVAIPNTASPNAFIAWWYDDLDFGRVFPGVTTSATTQITGTAPNRVRVFTFQNVGRYGSGTDGTVITAEVRLFETTNVIEVHYGSFTQTTLTPSLYSATVGYEATLGLGGAHTLPCAASCTTASWPTSTIYRYTP